MSELSAEDRLKIIRDTFLEGRDREAALELLEMIAHSLGGQGRTVLILSNSPMESVSAVGTAKLRYNMLTQSIEVSENGGAYRRLIKEISQ